MNISGKRASEHSHWVSDPHGVRVEPDPVPVSEPHLRGRIVVGIDGSDESLSALRRAAHLARRAATSLSVVVSWDAMSNGELAGLGWDPEQEARDMLAYGLHEVFGDTPPTWVSSALVEGSTAGVLVEQSRGAEMLVLGKKSHSGLTDLLMGSVSEKCANTASCPVLIVPFAD